MLAIHDSSEEFWAMWMVLFGSCSCGSAIAEKPNVMPVLIVPSCATTAARTCFATLPVTFSPLSGSLCVLFDDTPDFSSSSSVGDWIFGSTVESTREDFSEFCMSPLCSATVFVISIPRRCFPRSDCFGIKYVEVTSPKYISQSVDHNVRIYYEAISGFHLFPSSPPVAPFVFSLSLSPYFRPPSRAVPSNVAITSSCFLETRPSLYRNLLRSPIGRFISSNPMDVFFHGQRIPTDRLLFLFPSFRRCGASSAGSDGYWSREESRLNGNAETRGT